MRLEDFLQRGTLSVITPYPKGLGEIIAYVDKSSADKGYEEAKYVVVRDLGRYLYKVAEDVTENGFYLVSIIEIDDDEVWQKARFIAFGPTQKSCAKATERILGSDYQGLDPVYLTVTLG